MAADEGGEVARTRSRRPDRGALQARGGASAAGDGHDQQCADGLPLAVVTGTSQSSHIQAGSGPMGPPWPPWARAIAGTRVGAATFRSPPRPAMAAAANSLILTGQPRRSNSTRPSPAQALQRAFEEAVAQFHLAGGKAALDAAGGGHGEGQALPAVGFGEAGDVDHAEHLAVLRVADDGGGAGPAPALDAGAVVLGGVDLHRLPDGEARRRYRSSRRRRRCPSPVPVIVGLPLLSPCLLGLDRHRFRGTPGNAGFPAGHLATPVPVAVRGAQVIERK